MRRAREGAKRTPPVVGGLVALALVAASPTVWAADPAPHAAAPQEPRMAPPPLGMAYIQFGVAFTVEGVANAGPICSNAVEPCILGSGGGISMRAGWRPTETIYLGGAYEFSKQDPSKLYRLGILQQARAELRKYFPTGRSVSPFILAGLGLAGYGDEWAVATWGPTAMLGGGLEIELSASALLGVSLAYRPVYLHGFGDSSTLYHAAGIAHFVGFEVALEARDAL